MPAKKQDFVILQGETFQRVIRWEAATYIYKPITAITRAAPAQVTAVAHGLKAGWRAAVVSALGMTEINARHSPPRDPELKPVTVVDANNVTFNEVNSAGYSAYTSGGYLQYYTPVDITGFDAVMEIKDRIGGTVLMTLSVANSRIILDVAQNTISLNIAAADTDSALMVWRKGVHDIEMRSPTGVKTRIFQGSISVSREVTT